MDVGTDTVEKGLKRDALSGPVLDGPECHREQGGFAASLLLTALIVLLVTAAVGFGSRIMERESQLRVYYEQFELYNDEFLLGLDQSLRFLATLHAQEAGKTVAQRLERVAAADVLLGPETWVRQLQLFELRIEQGQVSLTPLWSSSHPADVASSVAGIPGSAGRHRPWSQQMLLEKQDWSVLANRRSGLVVLIHLDAHDSSRLPRTLALFADPLAEDKVQKSVDGRWILTSALLDPQYRFGRAHPKRAPPHWLHLQLQTFAQWVRSAPDKMRLQPLGYALKSTSAISKLPDLYSFLVPSSTAAAERQFLGRSRQRQFDVVMRADMDVAGVLAGTPFEPWHWLPTVLVFALGVGVWLYVRRRLTESWRQVQAIDAATVDLSRAMADVKGREAHLNAVIKVSMDAIITADTQGTVKSFSLAGERIFGYTAAEVVGHNLTMLMPEPYHSAHDGYLSKYADTGQRHVIGQRRRVKGLHATGHEFPLRLSVSECRTAGGVTYVGVISDLSETELVNEELRAFFDLSTDMFCLAGFDGYFKQMNQSWSRVLGYSIDELQQRPIMDLVHADDVAATRCEINRLAEPKHKTLNFDNRFRTRKGDYRWLRWSASTQCDGKLIYACARDVTTQVNYQQRTLEAMQQSEQANKKLLELDRLKSLFIATMSHELRTPLNSIIGFSNVMLQGLSGELNERQRDQLGRVYRSSKHLLEIISDIIDVSKIEAERFDSADEKFDLKEIVMGACELSQELAQTSGVNFSIEACQNLILTTDRRRLKQVILNLVSNAAKYSTGGMVRVTSKVHGGSVRITVTDQGVGIPKADLSLLFQPFVRLDVLRVERSGTGLGLYLSRKIVEKILLGSISVESQEGKGSAFSIDIPITRNWQPLDGGRNARTDSTHHRG